MGTDLSPIGNHKIRFKERHFSELTTEIKSVLDGAVFSNAEFLRRFALLENSNDPRSIRKIKTKQDWTIEEEDSFYDFAQDEEIYFYGPFDLILIFDAHKISFLNPPYRYWQWFEMVDDAHRDEWRKYLQQVVKLFAGDRVLYAADNGHHLDEFTCYEGSFEELENVLREKYGKSKTRFQEVAEDYENSYFIDDFKTIDWSRSEPLDDSYVEPDDKSNTAFDLKTAANKDNLKQMKFDNEALHHKLIDGKIHFYHLARIDGLLCVHSGIVGDKETLEVRLDDYAPFTFDRLVEAINIEGFGSHYDILFTVKFDSGDTLHSWQDAITDFEVELKWQGIGRKSGGLYSDEKIEAYFYVVDVELAKRLLADAENRNATKGNIEVYFSNENNGRAELS